jgi:hypothetical protein
LPEEKQKFVRITVMRESTEGKRHRKTGRRITEVYISFTENENKISNEIRISEGTEYFKM